jgi:DNA repair protein RecO (recombination protein O)
MLIRAQAIVCAMRTHGEHGAIVRALTADHGLLAGYVNGGRSRRMRPILAAGNIIAGEWRARTEDQLAALSAELVISRAALMTEPLAAAALDWTSALAAATLPEGQPYPAIHAALSGVLHAIEAASSARGWAPGLLGYERLLLRALGYGDATAPGGDVLDGLRVTGISLSTHLLTGRRADVMAARGRLISRLTRALG